MNNVTVNGIDTTHNLHLKCWVPNADGHPDFPVQNLPLGMFSSDSAAPQAGVAIGDHIISLSDIVGDLRDDVADAVRNATGSNLNGIFALGREAMAALRSDVSRLLTDETKASALSGALKLAKDCTMHMPFAIGGYTDFYTGIHHAENVGRLLRPDNPLLPNYKYVPIGYHGRTSSIRLSGHDVRRPMGQTKTADADHPVFGPSQRMDYELEMAIWVGCGNSLGQLIPIAEAEQHLAGLSLFNDWSARDIQAWEYQPLGPFLAKNFQSNISPWVITAEALSPFRVAPPPRQNGDPDPLPYLSDPADSAKGGFDVRMEVYLCTAAMRASGADPIRLSSGSMNAMYWTPAQLITHHSSNGCNLCPGDLLGTGTLSGSSTGSFGSLMEITRGGSVPFVLPNGESRSFLEDGDEVVMTAWCEREGFARIGFGSCRAKVLSAN